MIHANAALPRAPAAEEQENQSESSEHEHDGGDDDDEQLLSQNWGFLSEKTAGGRATGILHFLRRDRSISVPRACMKTREMGLEALSREWKKWKPLLEYLLAC